MTTKLGDIPGWAAALYMARQRFEHSYDLQTFEAAGALSFHELPKEASVLVVKSALDLVDTLKRCRLRPQAKVPRFELLRRHGGTNVIRLYIGIDNSGMTRAQQLSARQLVDEKRQARRAALYRLTRGPIANDNDPAFSDAKNEYSPSRFEVPINGRPAPGLRTRMSLRGALTWIGRQPWLCIRDGAWSDRDIVGAQ